MKEVKSMSQIDYEQDRVQSVTHKRMQLKAYLAKL
jgi:hypothetical protein